METERIEQLLEKFWAGETSLEDEQALRAFFREAPPDDRWHAEARLFQYYEEQQRKQLSDVRIEQEIRKEIRRPIGRSVRWTYNLMRLAAGIGVVVLATYVLRQEMYRQEADDTYADPQRAFEETKKALMMLSNGFRRAEEETSRLRLFHEAERAIQQPDTEEVPI